MNFKEKVRFIEENLFGNTCDSLELGLSDQQIEKLWADLLACHKIENEDDICVSYNDFVEYYVDLQEKEGNEDAAE